MKSRTNQPLFKDDGTLLTDAQLVSDIQANGGTKLYQHGFVFPNGNELYVISIDSDPITFDGTDPEDFVNRVMGANAISAKIYIDSSGLTMQLLCVYPDGETVAFDYDLNYGLAQYMVDYQDMEELEDSVVPL